MLTEYTPRSGADSPRIESKESDGSWSKLTAGEFKDSNVKLAVTDNQEQSY